MDWSQLKKRIEDRFAPSVYGRVELRQTRYHKAHDKMGRAWITIDGKEIINMCEFVWEMESWREGQVVRAAAGSPDYRDPQEQAAYFNCHKQVEANLRDKSLFGRHDFQYSLLHSLSLSIDDMLVSKHPLIRAIAMLDGRFGKRRLLKFNYSQQPEIIQLLHKFRCEAEAMKFPEPEKA